MSKSALRDRPEISRTVVEEKSRSDFEGFSAVESSVSLYKEKSSIDERNFPSRSVRVISGRSLSSEEIASIKLAALCPLPLNLAWHENRTSFFSCRKDGRSVHLRLHRLFAKAPTPVLEAVVGYAVKGDRNAGTIVRQMAHLYFSKQCIAPDDLESKGRFYDLLAIRERIQKWYFPDLDVYHNRPTTCGIAIGWSTHRRVGAFKCMTFGSYDRHRNQIRINPLLDDAAVPLYFLEFIVYHEILHARLPARIDARGRVHSHTREFRLREKQFLEFAAAKEWEKKSLQFFKAKTKRIRHGRP